MVPEPHPDLAPLSFLLGTWRGEGKGEYPTIEPFAYGEEVRFTHVGKPFLAYTQRTWALDDRRPLHAVAGHGIELMTHSIVSAPTAKEVTRVERSLRVDGDVLAYDLRMAAVGLPVTHHLHAELRRTDP